MDFILVIICLTVVAIVGIMCYTAYKIKKINNNVLNIIKSRLEVIDSELKSLDNSYCFCKGYLIDILKALKADPR